MAPMPALEVPSEGVTVEVLTDADVVLRSLLLGAVTPEIELAVITSEIPVDRAALVTLAFTVVASRVAAFPVMEVVKVTEAPRREATEETDTPVLKARAPVLSVLVRLRVLAYPRLYTVATALVYSALVRPIVITCVTVVTVSVGAGVADEPGVASATLEHVESVQVTAAASSNTGSSTLPTLEPVAS